jgi:hypothetical protein
LGVDVVVHLDLVPVGAQDAANGVAEHDVAKVADVGLLVGIDAGVFDHDLLAARCRGRVGGDHSAHEGGGIEGHVDVGTDRFGAGDAGGQLEGGHDLAGDLGGVAAQEAGEAEGDRRAVVARLVVGHLLNGHLDVGDPEAGEGAFERARELLLEVVHSAIQGSTGGRASAFRFRRRGPPRARCPWWPDVGSVKIGGRFCHTA